MTAPVELVREADLTVVVERWTPRQNRDLRKLVSELQEAGEYRRSKLMLHWRREHTVSNTWEALARRLEDLSLPWPLDWDLVDVALVRKVDEEEEVVVVQEKVKQPSQQQASAGISSDSASGLNARGQMRWTQQAVSDLLACHKLGLEAKTGCPDRRLAELVHREFLQRHPYCPIAPNVLLTKCYILRSELKSGKLVLTQEKEDTGEKYRGATGLRSWTTPMLQELLDSRRRAIHRRKMGGGNTAVLGDIWLEEFRAVFPDYRSSKKNLFRKFKWWRSKRQEERREGGARERRTISQELYQEVRALLESSQVILPPFVSSKVIMLGQQWVESGHREHQGSEEATSDNAAGAPSAEGTTSNTITLPGGAVLVARPATNTQAHSPRPAVPQEAPNVSITLGTKAKTGAAAPVLTNGATTPTPPARVVASLTALGLPLACLPSLLAVYREVRDTYKSLVMADYLVSWTQLVTARLRSTGLASSPSALLSCERLDALVQLLLEETVGRANMKTVVRPSPAVPCSPELLEALQDNLAAAGGCIQVVQNSTLSLFSSWYPIRSFLMSFFIHSYYGYVSRWVGGNGAWRSQACSLQGSLSLSVSCSALVQEEAAGMRLLWRQSWQRSGFSLAGMSRSRLAREQGRGREGGRWRRGSPWIWLIGGGERLNIFRSDPLSKGPQRR